MSQNNAHKAAKILLDTKSVLCNVQEPFQYTSGKIGPVYVDCRRLISFPEERFTLMNMAADLISNIDDIDYVAGGETAGIPYAAFIAERLEKPMLYVRKKPKGFGRMAQIEGHFHESDRKNVILTEDVQNFGSSKPVFIKALREADATIEHFFTLFDYGTRPAVKDLNKDLDITDHSLCTWWDVLDVARQENYLDTETLASVESYLKDPDSWAQPDKVSTS